MMYDNGIEMKDTTKTLSETKFTCVKIILLKDARQIIVYE